MKKTEEKNEGKVEKTKEMKKKKAKERKEIEVDDFTMTVGYDDDGDTRGEKGRQAGREGGESWEWEGTREIYRGAAGARITKVERISEKFNATI